ncbi:MAG: adenosylcobinamide-phosphate synthase CbiB [Candidatus Omnitrophica bacterium]|nr:adenosylcobinamide-phosphate synthase CbiB [Candidatus Omnitrophota bacterium]
MNCAMFIIPCAYLLDLAAGDPQFRWHPVRVMGRFVEVLERVLNREGYNRRLTGAILVFLTGSAAVFFTWAVLALSLSIHPALFLTVSVLMIYFSVSTKALADEAGKIGRFLKKGDVISARENLSLIVGRDTGAMDEEQVIRASVETVAESTMDGIVAPLFYAFIGGPVLAWFYKSVNTMDSMVGHKNKRYAEFGWAAARLDGLLNFAPSKITAFLINMAVFLYGKDWRSSIRWTAKYIFKGPSFNSDTAEAPMSGGLRIRLGGRNFYGGLAVDKPFLGDGFETLHVKHIGQSIAVCYLVSLLMLVTGGIFQMRNFL